MKMLMTEIIDEVNSVKSLIEKKHILIQHAKKNRRVSKFLFYAFDPRVKFFIDDPKTLGDYKVDRAKKGLNPSSALMIVNKLHTFLEPYLIQKNIRIGRKISLLKQLLCLMHKDEAELVVDLITGRLNNGKSRFAMKGVDSNFIASAFPGLIVIPDPKQTVKAKKKVKVVDEKSVEDDVNELIIINYQNNNPDENVIEDDETPKGEKPADKTKKKAAKKTSKKSTKRKAAKKTLKKSTKKSVESSSTDGALDIDSTKADIKRDDELVQ